MDLVAFGLPFGTAVQLQSNTISGGSGSTTLNVSTNVSTPRGIYIFAVIGHDGNLYHLATATLAVKRRGSTLSHRGDGLIGEPNSQYCLSSELGVGQPSRSRMTAIAALRPLIPMTLPPGCVHAPHR